MPKILLLFALILIAFGRVSPALADPPAVSSIALGTDYNTKKNKLVGEATTFAPTDHTIVCVLKLKGVDKSSTYTANWFVVKLDEPKNAVINKNSRYKANEDDKKEHQIATNSTKKGRVNLLTSKIEFKTPDNWPTAVGAPPPPKDWPEGTYRVDWLRYDDTLKTDVPVRSIVFTIKASYPVKAAPMAQ